MMSVIQRAGGAMAASLLLTISKFTEDVPRYRHADEVIERLHQATAPAGFNVLGAWRVPPRYDDWETWKRVTFLQRDIPSEFYNDWQSRAEKYGQNTMSAKAAREGTPFTWSECMRELKPSGESRWIFDLLRAYGMRDGFCCPVGPWVLHYSSSKLLRISQTERAQLYAAAVLTVQQLDKLIAGKALSRAPAVGQLSARQLEALRLSSIGMPAGQIAKHLGIAESTVCDHLKHARRKLGARRTTHAIELAIRARLLGVMSPSLAAAVTAMLLARESVAGTLAGGATTNSRRNSAADDEAMRVALSTAVAMLAISAAVSDGDGSEISNLTISGDGAAADVTDVSGSDSFRVVSGAAAKSSSIYRTTGTENGTIEIVDGKLQIAGTVSVARILEIDAEATPQLEGSNAVDAPVIMDETKTAWHFSDDGRAGKSAQDPSGSATTEDTPAQSTSADNGFIVSGDHSARLSMTSFEHHASADPEIGKIAKDDNFKFADDDAHPGKGKGKDPADMPAPHDDNGSPAAADGHPAHPHSDNFKFADDDSAHPGKAPKFADDASGGSAAVADDPAHPHSDNFKFADDDSAHPGKAPHEPPTALSNDLSGDHPAHPSKSNSDHHASADPEIGKIAKDHPAHPHSDNFKFADDDSAHPGRAPNFAPAAPATFDVPDPMIASISQQIGNDQPDWII
jgi:DNA-binding CsgD family transcriptional regulator